MAPITRKRTYPTVTYGGTTDVYFLSGGSWSKIGTSKSSNSAVGSQVTYSLPTLFPLLEKTKRSNPRLYKEVANKIDAGGEFYTSKTYVVGDAQHRSYQRITAGIVKEIYDGKVSPCPVESLNLPVLPPLSSFERANLVTHGTTAIARCIPTNPVSGLANFLGELKRDGFPKAPGAGVANNIEQGRVLRNLGSEHLNIEFALLPTYNDLKSFASTVKNHKKILDQYLRDSGRPIHRRYQFPSERTVTTQVENNQVPHGGPTWFNGGTRTTETVTTVERWFSGEFTYYLELGNSVSAQLAYYEQQANKLLGTRLNADLVWNLAPWSWAADWVSNAGDVFHNISAFQADGLVMRYGYMMEQTTIVKTITLDGYSLASGVQGSIAPLTLRVVQQRKARIKASPFGFGVETSGLSPRQLSIIAALGISRNVIVAK